MYAIVYFSQIQLTLFNWNWNQLNWISIPSFSFILAKRKLGRYFFTGNFIFTKNSKFDLSLFFVQKKCLQWINNLMNTLSLKHKIIDILFVIKHYGNECVLCLFPLECGFPNNLFWNAKQNEQQIENYVIQCVEK